MPKPFVKGDSRINKAGRPKGSPNRTTEELRSLLKQFIDSNLDQLQADFDKLDPKDRLAFLDRIIKHVLPPVPPENLLEGMSDEDLEKLVKHLRRELK